MSNLVHFVDDEFLEIELDEVGRLRVLQALNLSPQVTLNCTVFVNFQREGLTSETCNGKNEAGGDASAEQTEIDWCQPRAFHQQREEQCDELTAGP